MSKGKNTDKNPDRKTKPGHGAAESGDQTGTAKTMELGRAVPPDDDTGIEEHDGEGPDLDQVLGALDSAIDAAILTDDPGEDAAPNSQHQARANTVPYGGKRGEDGAPVASADPAESLSTATPLNPDEAAELLGRVNLFADLPAPFLKRIASICEEERYEYGTKIFKEGSPGDRLYLIHTGAVRISRNVPGMGEEALAVLKAGDYFGEMALIDDFPRSADAIAHEACRLVIIGKDKLADLLFIDRDLAYDLLWTFVRTLSSRLRQTNDKMTFMAVTSKF